MRRRGSPNGVTFRGQKSRKREHRESRFFPIQGPGGTKQQPRKKSAGSSLEKRGEPLGSFVQETGERGTSSLSPLERVESKITTHLDRSQRKKRRQNLGKNTRHRGGGNAGGKGEEGAILRFDSSRTDRVTLLEWKRDEETQTLKKKKNHPFGYPPPLTKNRGLITREREDAKRKPPHSVEGRSTAYLLDKKGESTIRCRTVFAEKD